MREGWKTVQLGDVAKAVGGSGFPKEYQGKNDRQYPFFKVSDMNAEGNEMFMNHAAHYVSSEDLRSMKAKHHPAGTIVFPKIGGAISTNKKRILTSDAAFDNNVMGVIPTPDISSEFLYKIFLNLDLYELSNKAALPFITNGAVEEIEIPLPPLDEQRRIVRILDQAFDAIATAKANAERNLANATALFESHLDSIFADPGGTGEDRNSGPPWNTKPLEAACVFINGLWKGKKPPFVKVGVIRNTNFTKDGSLDDSDIAFIEVESKQLASRRLQFGDIILEKSGGGPKQAVGRVALFDKDEGDFSFSNFTAALRVKDPSELDSRFLHKFLYWIYVSGVTKTMQSHSTGIRNLNGSAYKAIAIPVPPLIEQQEIVQVLNSLRGETDRLEALFALEFAALDELKQSLLHQAFAGEL